MMAFAAKASTSGGRDAIAGGHGILGVSVRSPTCLVSNSESHSGYQGASPAMCQSEYERMPDNTSPRLRNGPFTFRSLAPVALAAAVVTGASLSGLASGAVQKLPWTAGSRHDSAILAEQRRQASALEKIEVAVSRARADVALLNARADEAENQHLEAAKPAIHSATGSDREFDLGALRSSLDEQAERNRNELRTVNKRLDWLEKLIYGQDATGPVQLAA